MKINSIELLKNGLIAGIISFIISAMLNYFFLPFPESVVGNAISHGTGGFFCGFFSAVIGIIMYKIHNKENSHSLKTNLNSVPAVKNIVITGASKGLGKELAKRLSQSNHNLILIARNKELLESVQKEIQLQTGKTPLIVPCDISNESDVRTLTVIISEKYKYIDVLVNNAGIGIPKLLEEMDSEEMRRQFEINCYGAIYCIKALLPLLKVSHSGYIINIGSLLGKISFAQTSIYSATKFALHGFTEGFRHEMKKSSIKVGFFMPGPMKTSFQDNRQEGQFTAPKFLTQNPGQAARIIEKMIKYRKKNTYKYRWILFLMKIKLLSETLD